MRCSESTGWDGNMVFFPKCCRFVYLVNPNMSSKKVFGYLFIALAAILTLAILGQLQALLSAISGIFIIFTGKLNGYQSGVLFGHFIYWVIHISLTVLLWNYGIKWTKRQRDQHKK